MTKYTQDENTRATEDLKKHLPKGCTLFVLIWKTTNSTTTSDIYHFFPDKENPVQTASSRFTYDIAVVLQKLYKGDRLVLTRNGAGDTLYTDLIEDLGIVLYDDPHSFTYYLLRP
jgi:hypothetical protein